MLSDQERQRAAEWEAMRKLRAMSQSQLAQRVGIKQQSMRLILAGVNKPRAEHAQRIQDVLENIPHCDTCKRAFIGEVPSDLDHQGETAEGEAHGKTVSGVPPRSGRRR